MTITFLEHEDHPIGMAIDVIKVSVGESAPPLLKGAAQPAKRQDRLAGACLDAQSGQRRPGPVPTQLVTLLRLSPVILDNIAPESRLAL